MSTVLWINANIWVLSLIQPLNLTWLADLHSHRLPTKKISFSTKQEKKKKCNKAFHWGTIFVAQFKVISHTENWNWKEEGGHEAQNPETIPAVCQLL